MAETKETIRNNYPLPVYNFRVTVDGTSMSFSEVSGIEVEYDTVTYRHGFSFWEGVDIYKYYHEKYVNVTFKRGTIHNKKFLYDWLKNTKTVRVDVSLCDETGTPVVTWILAKATPVKLQAPSFDANSNDLSIETLDVMAAGISVEHH